MRDASDQSWITYRLGSNAYIRVGVSPTLGLLVTNASQADYSFARVCEDHSSYGSACALITGQNRNARATLLYAWCTNSLSPALSPYLYLSLSLSFSVLLSSVVKDNESTWRALWPYEIMLAKSAANIAASTVNCSCINAASTMTACRLGRYRNSTSGFLLSLATPNPGNSSRPLCTTRNQFFARHGSTVHINGRKICRERMRENYAKMLEKCKCEYFLNWYDWDCETTCHEILKKISKTLVTCNLGKILRFF